MIDRFHIFVEGKTDKVAAKFGIPVLAKLPIDTKLPALCDRGMIELMENEYLDVAADVIERRLGLAN